jgi:predicted GIY-YIG superfamily endonuclease
MSAAVAQFPAERFVYVIGAADGPQKIGIATKPQQRLLEFQTGNPARLAVQAMVPASSDEARAVEAKPRSRRTGGAP